MSIKASLSLFMIVCGLLISCREGPVTPTSNTRIENPPSGHTFTGDSAEALKASFLKKMNLVNSDITDQQQAFDYFMQNTAVADYLLNSQLNHEHELQLKLLLQRNSAVIDAYMQSYIADKISDAALQEYFNAHQAEFSDHYYTVAQIFLRLGSDANIIKTKEIMSKAEEIVQRHNSGAKFGLLVKEFSQDNATRNKDGVLPVFSAQESNNIIVDAVSALKVGEISGPVRSQRGVHIYKLLDKKKQGEIAFHDAKAKIRARLAEQLVADEMQRLAALTSTNHPM